MKQTILSLLSLPLLLANCDKAETTAAAPAASAAGSPAEIVEFFQMMNELPPGAEVTDMKLEVPDAAQQAKFAEAMEMPDGKSYKLTVKPSHRLVISMKESAGDSKGTSTISVPVAEVGGKLGIPLPVEAK